MRTLVLAWAASLGVVLPVAVAAQAPDAAAAEGLMKKSGCMKCHSVSAKKEGPSFKATAAKYKGKPDAEAALIKHLTTNPKIKVDGKEELHDSLKTKNEGEIKNESSFVDDLGADSLDTVELVMALEEEFETEIPDEEAEKITTVQQAVDYIKAHAKS